MWRRAMLYLGLGPDDEYDDYEVVEEQQPAPNRYAPPEPPEAPSGAVRPLPRERERDRERESVQLREPEPPSVVTRPRPTGVVRQLQAHPATAKPTTVAPGSFNEAQDVADKFMAGTPVILNLQAAERELSRRLVDFASGLCYGLRGQMERVANQVYLLTPSNAHVADEERRRLQERSL